MNQALQIIDDSEALRKLMSLARDFNSNTDLGAVLTDIMRAAEELVEADAASLLLVEETTGDLLFQVALGAEGGTLQQKRLPKGQGIAGWVVQHGSPVNVPDVNADPRFAASFDRQTGYTTRNLLAVPLCWNNRLIGVLEAVNKLEGTFTATDERLLTLFSEGAAAAVGKAKLMEALQDMNLQLERAVAERTEKLAATNAQLTAVVQSVEEGLAIIGPDFQVEWMNDTMQTWMGSYDTVKGLTCYQAFHGRETPCEDCPTLQAMHTGLTEKTTEAVWSLEGTPRSCEVTVSVVRSEQGEISQFVEAVRDITEHKELEQAKVLAAKLQTIGAVVASINHEINNPLTVILGNSLLLQKQAAFANGKVNQQLESIAQSARRISEVTHKLSDVVRPVSRDYAGHLKMLDLEASLSKS